MYYTTYWPSFYQGTQSGRSHASQPSAMGLPWHYSNGQEAEHAGWPLFANVTWEERDMEQLTIVRPICATITCGERYDIRNSLFPVWLTFCSPEGRYGWIMRTCINKTFQPCWSTTRLWIYDTREDRTEVVKQLKASSGEHAPRGGAKIEVPFSYVVKDPAWLTSWSSVVVHGLNTRTSERKRGQPWWDTHLITVSKGPYNLRQRRVRKE